MPPTISSNPSPFSLPDKGEVYIEQVVDRCKNLAAGRVWGGLSPLALDHWMKNFTNSLERYFAASVLDALIYRSSQQTIALMEQVFQRSIPDLLRRRNKAWQGWDDRLMALTDKSETGIRLVPVIRADDPPTKSGPHLARLYRRHMNFNDDWMIWPWQISRSREKGVNIFIFIDDFLGSGRQFTDFDRLFDLKKQLAGSLAIYAPLVAHAKGVERVSNRSPHVSVCSAEALSYANGLFHPQSKHFSDGVNSPASAMSYYYELVKRKSIGLNPKSRKGFGSLALAYSFEHGTPNNCLPLFWIETPSWVPLFRR
jgi:hypothetical protein